MTTLLSNGSGYAATWDSSISGVVPINVYDGTSWGTQTSISPATQQTFPQILSNGTGYLVYWTDIYTGDTVRNFYAAVSPTGKVADFVPTRVGDDSAQTRARYAATNGSGYSLAWSTNGSATDCVFASVWDGAWSGPTTLDSGSSFGYLSHIAGNSTTGEYAVGWQVYRSADGTQTCDRARRVRRHHLARQGDPRARRRSVRSGRLRREPSTARRRRSSPATAMRSVLWRQAPAGGDPNVQLPFVYDGLR